jgi:hypothetical protein
VEGEKVSPTEVRYSYGSPTDPLEFVKDFTIAPQDYDQLRPHPQTTVSTTPIAQFTAGHVPRETPAAPRFHAPPTPSSPAWPVRHTCGPERRCPRSTQPGSSCVSRANQNDQARTMPAPRRSRRASTHGPRRRRARTQPSSSCVHVRTRATEPARRPRRGGRASPRRSSLAEAIEASKHPRAAAAGVAHTAQFVLRSRENQSDRASTTPTLRRSTRAEAVESSKHARAAAAARAHAHSPVRPAFT